MSASLKDIRALIVDLDGVITDTAQQHFRAWKRMFDAYLEEQGASDASDPFTEEDYREYVDGKPRIEGADSFLRSRDFVLERGNPDDPADAETLWGLGNRKNRFYREILEDEGVQPFPDAMTLLRSARDAGLPCAMVSSSRNAGKVVEAAGIERFFLASVDGRDLADGDLAGKPAPDLFLEAARRLGVDARDAAVLEDARSGVQAGRRGGFGKVVGVARHGEERALLDAGADFVVSRLDEIDLPSPFNEAEQ
ncbi:MAG: beta-phosphoglucomutase family hydrolase [Gemmatimonadota bacterium]